MTLSDSETLNDVKQRAVSLRQLSYLLYWYMHDMKPSCCQEQSNLSELGPARTGT